MAVEHMDLPDDQSIEIERRPTHGIIRKIARETQRAQRGQDPLEAEDMLVINLVKAWDVKDDEGRSIELKRAEFDRVPQDTWGRIVDECTTVLEGAIPNPGPRMG